MKSFHDIELPTQLINSLEKINFVSPTPIQEQSIPKALEGKDILASAATGTGKTAAFSIPLIAKLLNNPHSQGLILAPTRELAIQIVGTIQSLLGKSNHIKTALIIGGQPMHIQFRQLRAKPRIIVGTPGRIYDHLQQQTISLEKIDFWVLDETDRMLNMGFDVQLRAIAEYFKTKPQTLMFSATLPNNIIKLSNEYLVDPARVTVGCCVSPTENVSQEQVYLNEGDKYERLVTEINNSTGRIIVFVKTKAGAQKLSDRLREQKHFSSAIHGDLRQSKREQILTNFRKNKSRILIATDVASRGIDVPGIERVINYHLPTNPEDYVHRIGRTGRAGEKGSAISFLTPEDNRSWRAIQQFMNPNMKFEDDRSKKRNFKYGSSQSGSQGRYSPKSKFSSKKGFLKNIPHQNSFQSSYKKSRTHKAV